MSIASAFRWLLGRACRLPPRESGLLSVSRDIPVAMRDGIELLADHYRLPDRQSGPVVLIRSPYGRGRGFGVMAALLAERGFQAVIQSVRGTSGSGGELNPMRQEQDDGEDTLTWVRAQPWFGGKLFTFGTSYLGYAQWALADAAPDKLDGMAMSMTLSNFRDEILGFGGFTQGGTLAWSQTVLAMTDPKGRMRRPRRGSLDKAHAHLPVGSIDQVAFGRTLPWWQQWVEHEDREDPWWNALDHSRAPAKVSAPVFMVAGWKDIFLPFQLQDFATRQAAGQKRRLIVGPWMHSSPGGMIESLRQAIDQFSALANGERAAGEEKNCVRLYLQGADEWREYPDWPPADARPLLLHLGPGGQLSPNPAPFEGRHSEYVYYPADPTPAVHGPVVIGGARIRNMRKLEQRSDSVTFTSDVLEADLDVIGPVTATLSVRSDREHTDFYVCLCDVDRWGRSIQVLDGYRRLRPGRPAADADGVRQIVIECWPTAYRFQRGHRLRLIVASGAHPRYARNTGSGEPLATATQLLHARQQILHSAGHTSTISLLTVD